jgi:hypothetical protein
VLAGRGFIGVVEALMLTLYRIHGSTNAELPLSGVRREAHRSASTPETDTKNAAEMRCRPTFDYATIALAGVWTCLFYLSSRLLLPGNADGHSDARSPRQDSRHWTPLFRLAGVLPLRPKPLRSLLPLSRRSPPPPPSPLHSRRLRLTLLRPAPRAPCAARPP